MPLRRSKRGGEDQGAFWISYSDLSTGLLLVFILLFLSQMALSQTKIDSVKSEIQELLGVHEKLSAKLEDAVTNANARLDPEGKTKFFVHRRGVVTVYIPKDQEVAWFDDASAQLRAAGQEQVRVFYEELYRALLMEDGRPVVPRFLASINIEGHTDPKPLKNEFDYWTWDSYNGNNVAGHGAKASNLTLSQLRAKAILDYIQSLYTSEPPVIDDSAMPWRPFVALVQATGRSWTRAYHFAEGDTNAAELTPSDFLLGVPELPKSKPLQDRANALSRRVTFSFRLNDGELLQKLKEKFDVLDTGSGR